MTTGTIWVGTNTGNVVAMGIQVKPSTKDHPRTIKLCPNAHKIHHPTISMSFLDDVGGTITTLCVYCIKLYGLQMEREKPEDAILKGDS
ncbi:uncharacterized protein [Dysidea avara]